MPIATSIFSKLEITLLMLFPPTFFRQQKEHNKKSEKKRQRKRPHSLNAFCGFPILIGNSFLMCVYDIFPFFFFCRLTQAQNIIEAISFSSSISLLVCYPSLF